MPDYIESARSVLEEAKKLTTENKKNLKESTFCGPERSFPVSDCKHVAAAKSYLGRSKFSDATKKKIAACIDRKAKQLGCDVSKKTEASSAEFPKFIELSYEQKQLYSSDIFDSTRLLVEASIRNPGADLDFEGC